MDRYKLYNTLKNELKEDQFPYPIKEEFSYSRIKELFKNYELVEFVEKHYCCYGEDTCCWIDEDVCWTPKWWTKEQVTKRFYKFVKDIIHHLEKEYKKINIFRQENDEVVVITIPSRTLDKTDYYLVFNKKWQEVV